VSTTDFWASFDCYGTLIDWNGGLRSALGSDELLEQYHELEPQVQAENPRRSYRDVMTEVSRRLGVADEDALARSLPEWEPFPEVPPALERARARGWKLAILSNTDRDFIEASMERIGVPFELAIVASEIGSYKPRHAHWQRFFERVDVPYDRYVHVAQSHFHDIVPARELGLRSVWINRYGERHAPGATRELRDLTRLPETLDELAA
jgi:2-haloacid dehalogenase